MKPLSPTQVRVIRGVKRMRDRGYMSVQIAGGKTIHLVSSARALVRKGLLEEHNGKFFLTDEGHKWLEENPS